MLSGNGLVGDLFSRIGALLTSIDQEIDHTNEGFANTDEEDVCGIIWSAKSFSTS
jgi:hypothetical protein